MKRVWQEFKGVFMYLAAVFTNRYFLISFGFMVGGWIAWNLSVLLQTMAASLWGPATIPYTSSVAGVFSIVVLGGLIGLIISEIIASSKWFKMQNNKTITVAEKLVFNDKNGIVTLGEKSCQLPPFKNEHCFYRAMAAYPIGEPVDWSLVYTAITGMQDVRDVAKDKKMVYDTYEQLNARISNDLGIDQLFVWKDKTIRKTQ
jgi:hypothetical protein